MKRGPVVNVAALVTAIVAWKLAAEREAPVTRRERRSPVTVELRDGSHVSIEVDTADAAPDSAAPVLDPVPARSERRRVLTPARRARARAGIELGAGLSGLAASTYALTHPFELLAWPVGIGGALLALAASLHARGVDATLPSTRGSRSTGAGATRRRRRSRAG